VSSKSSSHCCGLRVSSTPLERQKALPFPYDLSSLQDVLHTMCGAHFLSWSPSLHPKYRWWAFLIRGVIERLCDASVTFPHTHNRIGPHCSHKSETSCPTPALLRTETEALSGDWCSDLIMWPYSSHSVSRPWLMTLSCTLVSALVARD
jgi:hypothetical protein